MDTTKDVSVMLDSLNELFSEQGDMVTPTDLAERMSQKLNRTIKYCHVGILLKQLGFLTLPPRKYKSRMQRFIYRDSVLLEKWEAESSQIEERAKASVDAGLMPMSPYSKDFKKDFNYWLPNLRKFAE
jgi:hypothetical protein